MDPNREPARGHDDQASPGAGGDAAGEPAWAPDVLPPHPLPPPGSEPVPEGSNATIHRPDPDAAEHPAREDRKPRGPYVTGNS
jgi:hypothetical protein